MGDQDVVELEIAVKDAGAGEGTHNPANLLTAPSAKLLVDLAVMQHLEC